MKIEENVTPANFLSKIRLNWHKTRNICLSILGWQDGDWFESLCNEHGGPKDNSLEMFQRMPIGKTFSDISTFVDVVQPYCEIKCLGSKDGNYQFIYDIYTWSGKYIWIYNPYLEKMIQKQQRIIDRLLGILPSSPWINETLINPNQKIKKPPYFSPMETGNMSLVLDENVNYDTFPVYASKWAGILKLTVEDKIDGPSERIWKVKIDRMKFLLAYDDWSPEISLEPKDNDAGKAIIEIGRKLGVKE